MTQTEFLMKLKGALSGNISSVQVKENLEYYEQYIEEEMRKGKSEEEIFAVLGDPWILARTIIDASDGTDRETVYGNSQETSRAEAKMDRSYAGRRNSENKEKNTMHMLGLDTWWKKLLLVFFILLLIFVILSIVTGFIRLFLPIIVPFIFIVILMRVFFRRR